MKSIKQKTTTPKKILVIEDVRSLSRALELKLTKEGFSVTSVPDGEQGIQVMTGQTFDLIILDLIMPKLDGFSVLENMRTSATNTPVIVLTNLSQIEDEKRVTDLGAAEFFVKSETSVVNLVGHIKSLLSEALPLAA